MKGNIGIFEKFVTLEDIENLSILNQLKQLDLVPDNIDIIINSHLHFDHCSGNHFFPGKQILIQQKELLSYKGSRKNPMYISLTMDDCPNFFGIEGDYDIFSDDLVHLLPAYGHSDGQQILTIESDNLFLLFLADTCYIKDGRLLPIEVEGMKNYQISVDTICFINKLLADKTRKNIKIFSSHDFNFEQEAKVNSDYNQIIKYIFNL